MLYSPDSTRFKHDRLEQELPCRRGLQQGDTRVWGQACMMGLVPDGKLLWGQACMMLLLACMLGQACKMGKDGK